MNEAQKRAVEITGDFLANFARRVLRGETDCIEAETVSLLHLQREAGVVLLMDGEPDSSGIEGRSWWSAFVQPIVEETE